MLEFQWFGGTGAHYGGSLRDPLINPLIQSDYDIMSLFIIVYVCGRSKWLTNHVCVCVCVCVCV